MPQFLCITVRFLDPVPSFHGQHDGGEPEWPPSPLRLFQAIVDAAANRWRELQFGEYAQPLLAWLERLGHPEIVTPTHVFGIPFRLSGPNNDMDAPARKWVKGVEPTKPHRPIDLRTMKSVNPTHIRIRERKHGGELHYLFALPDSQCPHLDILQTAARSITHLGWGIDMAVGDAAVLDAEHAAQLDGVRWRPSSSGTPLRVPKVGTLDDLIRKHTDFLNRITDDGFRPVPPLRMFDIVRYRRDTDPLPRPHAVFRLIDGNDDTVAYPHAKLIHVAGMVKHLAIRSVASKRLLEKLYPNHDQTRDPFRDGNPPRNLRGSAWDEWVEQYIAGHQSKVGKDAGLPHAQFSYVPLPSTGFHHTNPAVRRVMIVAPLGDESWLDHLARRLDGELLKALSNTTLPPGTRLERIPSNRKDGVRDAYTRDSRTWASFTPVILPGHDDHKPEKTRKLILKALAQSGIDQPCEFEWNAFSRFPKSFSAHKYIRDESAKDGKRLIGYIRPDHLQDLSAVHLVLRFGRREDPRAPGSRWIPAEQPVPGPFTLGAGRHCGFGLMAAVDG